MTQIPGGRGTRGMLPLQHQNPVGIQSEWRDSFLTNLKTGGQAFKRDVGQRDRIVLLQMWVVESA